LVLLVEAGLAEPDCIKQAIGATFRRRATHPLPGLLPEPPLAWAGPYAALARALGLPVSTLQEAYAYLDAYWQRWGLGQVDQTECTKDEQ
jgi:hypothetical protein